MNTSLPDILSESPEPIVETVHPTVPGRFYTTSSGVSYPSVTTILAAHSRDGIAKWRARVGDVEADRISLEAREWGSTFHEINEMILTNRDPSEKITSLPRFRRQILDRFTPLLNRITNVRFIEYPLYSDKLRVAGRVDCIADFDGKLSIIDFKTSRKRKVVSYIENYMMQGTAYSLMAEERLGIVPKQIAILIAVESDKPQVFTVKPSYYFKDLIKYRNLFEHTHGLTY